MRIVRLTDECGNEMAIDLDKIESIRMDGKNVVVQVGRVCYSVKCQYGELLVKWAEGGSICNLKEDKEHGGKTGFAEFFRKKIGDW